MSVLLVINTQEAGLDLHKDGVDELLVFQDVLLLVKALTVPHFVFTSHYYQVTDQLVGDLVAVFHRQVRGEVDEAVAVEPELQQGLRHNLFFRSRLA